MCAYVKLNYYEEGGHKEKDFNTFFNVNFTKVWTLIYTNMKEPKRLHYGTY